MKFSAITFDGIQPVKSARLLGENQAQTAENCELTNGNLKPIVGLSQDATLAASDRISIYPYNSAWLSWTTDVNVVASPIQNDAYKQIFYTGSGTPKVRATSGAVETEYTLGVPAPTSVITGVAVAKATQSWTRNWYYQYEEPDGTISQSGTLREGNYSDTFTGAATNKGGGKVGLPATAHGFQSGDTLIVHGTTNYDATYVADSTTTANEVVVTATYIAEDITGKDLWGQVDEVTAGKSYRMYDLPAKGASVTTDAVFILYFNAYEGTILLGRLYPTTSAQNNARDFYLDGAQADAAQTNASTAPEATYTITYDTSRASEYKAERAWLYTFETTLGKEGPPSDASAIVAIDPTQDATLTGFDTSVTGRSDITLINIYRTVVDPNTGATDYQFVKSVAIGTTSTTDDVADSDTGATLLTGGQTWRPAWIAPPDAMSGLVMMPGRFMAGFYGNTVYFSVPNYFHAWPAAYDISLPYDVVSIGVTENTLIVTTKGNIYAMIGDAPDAISVVALDLPQGCASKRSMVSGLGMLIYASPDGLVACKGATATMITQWNIPGSVVMTNLGYYDRDKWQAITPSSIMAAFHDGRYYGWATGGNIIFDLNTNPPKLTTTDEEATGSYVDLETDLLYVIQSDKVMKWKGGTSNLTAKWRSRLFHLSREESPYVARVVADSYTNVTLRFRANDTNVLELPITSNEARKVPMLRKEKTWDFEVETDATVHELTIAESMSEL